MSGHKIFSHRFYHPLDISIQKIHTVDETTCNNNNTKTTHPSPSQPRKATCHITKIMVTYYLPKNLHDILTLSKLRETLNQWLSNTTTVTNKELLKQEIRSDTTNATGPKLFHPKQYILEKPLSNLQNIPKLFTKKIKSSYRFEYNTWKVSIPYGSVMLKTTYNHTQYIKHIITSWVHFHHKTSLWNVHYPLNQSAVNIHAPN